MAASVRLNGKSKTENQLWRCSVTAENEIHARRMVLQRAWESKLIVSLIVVERVKQVDEKGDLPC
jgi:hypothetical protein